jgi:hypothetical protein
MIGLRKMPSLVLPFSKGTNGKKSPQPGLGSIKKLNASSNTPNSTLSMRNFKLGLPNSGTN